VAVEAEALDAINLLLNGGADPHILNPRKLSPIHLAVALSKHDALKVGGVIEIIIQFYIIRKVIKIIITSHYQNMQLE